MSNGDTQPDKVIEQLYSSFQQLDGEAMAACYHKDAYFRDEVFELHSGHEVGAMWTMLCKRAKEFKLTYSDIEVIDSEGKAYWEASYLFSKTGRKVHNKINASFKFRDGLIIEHIDSFDFWKWSRMALGTPGLLLGWSGFLRKKVQQEARAGLKIGSN